jgi:type I restriction enzyme S subunit
MVKYDTYKDSGIEWIGDIPKHWEVKRLKYIGDSIIGITYSPKEVVQEKETLVLRSSNIQNGKLSLKDTVYINKEIPKRLETRIGDILICSRNGSRKLIGKNITIDKKTEGETFGAFMTVFRTEQYQFISKYFNSQVFSGQSGLFLTSTINQLTVNTLNNFYTALPPEDEQKHIAKYLDEKTSEIDELISQKKELIKLFEKEKQIAINKAITKGLKSDVKLKYSGINWLGNIPKHWEIKKLKYVAKMQGGFAFSSKDFTTDGTQIIKIANLYQNKFQVNRQPTLVSNDFLKTHSAWIIEEGDILMSMTGTLGKRDYGFAILIEKSEKNYLLNQRVSKIHSINNINVKFLLYLLRSQYFLNNLFSLPAGTKQGNFSNEDILNQSIVFPILKEQNEIVQHIETEANRINGKSVKTKKLIELLKEYKVALISDVVTGKIKVY